MRPAGLALAGFLMVLRTGSSCPLPIFQIRLERAAGLRTATAVTATMKRRTIMALS
jgi:hypothetical protein